MKHRTERKHQGKEESGARSRRIDLWGIALLAVLLCAISCGSDGSEGPKTRTVSRTKDADFKSIQKCISHSSDRDTCLVYPGTYKERIRFRGKAITVRSSAGAERTIIDGGRLGTVVTFSDAEGDDSVLKGFTIMNGLAVSGEETIEHGGGIQLISAGPTIQDCILMENQADGDGGGIYSFSTGAKPRIENVIFQGNTAGVQGGALCSVYGGPDLSNCLFLENQAAVGGAISARFSTQLVLTNCTIADNSATDQAGALYLKNTTAETTYSIYWNNSSAGDSPVVIDLDDDPELEGDMKLSLSFVDFQGGTGDIQSMGRCLSPSNPCVIDEGDGMLDTDPLFVPLSLEDPLENPWQAFYLSEPDTLRSDQTQLGRSPCVDAGNLSAEEAGLETRTTRTDGIADEDMVDLGYHYALPTS